MPVSPKANILLVDDRDENLLALEAVLADLGENVVLARSGEEALQQLSGKEFAVIVLDVQMPGMDGFETAERIRSRQSLREIPIILLTAIHHDEKNTLKGYSVGAVDYIYKPFSIEVLKAKIRFFVELFRTRQRVQYQSELLSQARQDLEQQVLEGTRDLEAANRQLKFEIIEHARVEKELRRSQQELEDLFDNASTGIHWLAADGKILRANQAELDLVGYNREEYVGHNIREFHADPHVIEEFLDRLSRNETLFNYEARLRHKDGSLRHVLINSNVRWEGKEFIHTRCFTRDITERLRTDHSLSRLAAIVNSSDDAILSKTLDGIIVSWNAGAERLYGYSAEEVRGQPVSILAPDDRAEEMVEILRRLRQGERIDHYETVRLHKDGHRVYVSLSISPIKNRAGEIIGASTIARDITERKRAQDRLDADLQAMICLHRVGALSVQADAQFDVVLGEIVDAAIAISGADKGNLQLFDASSKTLKIKAHHGFESSFLNFFATTADEASACVAAKEPGTRVVVEDVCSDPLFAGAPSLAVLLEAGVRAMQSTPLVSSADHLLGIISTHLKQPHRFSERELRLMDLLARQAADFVERKYAEEALRRAAAFDEAVMSNMGEGLYTVDSQGLVTFMNPAAERLFGWTLEELRGRKMHDMTHYKHPDGSAFPLEDCAGLQVLRQGNALTNHEDVFVRKDGTFFDVVYSSSPLREGNQVIGLVVVFRDVTDRKAVEKERDQFLAREQEARKQAEEAQALAEAANRVKDEFLATLSHELRTPLNAILGWTRILRSSQLDPETASRALAVIERNGRFQNQLIGDLLDVSNITKGKLRLDVQIIDLASILEAAVDTVRPSADAKAIRLQVVLDPKAGPVAGDPNRLQQIVWNLLSNAIKFTPKEGRVQLRLERINSHIEITVSDTGAGIAPDFLPYVFERFRQADASASRKQSGLGLGLAIVRHLVELHGGTVHVDSAGEDQGTTFTVRLPLMIVQDWKPLTEQTPERLHPVAGLGVSVPITANLSGTRVLAVDDEPDALESLRLILEKYGAEVRTGRSTAEGLKILEDWKPDVLLADIGMPNEDGYAFIRTVRSLSPEQGGEIFAAALTAYSRTEDRVRALNAGFQMHLPKPVESSELITAVESLARLSQKAYKFRKSGL